MDKKKIFIFLGIFWLVIIGGFIGFKEYTLRTGQEVLLKTTPVDPRDLFRGDYVVLRYDISNIDSGTVVADRTDFKSGDRVYVGLDIKEKYAVATNIYSTPPTDGLYIKGIVKDVSGNRFNIEYGIESYFVPEGKGRDIERQLSRSVDVKVAIDKSGNAVIKTLLIDGQEVKFK